MDTTSTTSYATDTSVNSGSAAGGAVVMVLYLAFFVLMIASVWKLFTKAGKPGWAAIVPVYNLLVELEIVGRPAWWLLLFLIPFVNLVMLVILSLDLAKAFGKGPLFGIFGLLIFPFVGFPMLAFGSSEYQGPVAAGSVPPTTPPTTPIPPAAPTPPTAPPAAPPTA